jgi:hypothetical protein
MYLVHLWILGQCICQCVVLVAKCITVVVFVDIGVVNIG